jgi:hypothetical protein
LTRAEHPQAGFIDMDGAPLMQEPLHGSVINGESRSCS